MGLTWPKQDPQLSLVFLFDLSRRLNRAHQSRTHIPPFPVHFCNFLNFYCKEQPHRGGWNCMSSAIPLSQSSKTNIFHWKWNGVLHLSILNLFQHPARHCKTDPVQSCFPDIFHPGSQSYGRLQCDVTALHCSATDLWPHSTSGTTSMNASLHPRGESSCERAYQGSLCFLAHHHATEDDLCMCLPLGIHS